MVLVVLASFAKALLMTAKICLITPAMIMNAIMGRVSFPIRIIASRLINAGIVMDMVMSDAFAINKGLFHNVFLIARICATNNTLLIFS